MFVVYNPNNYSVCKLYPLLKKRGVVASSSIRKFKQGLYGFSTYLVALNP